MGKERKGFLQANVGPGMGKTHFPVVIVMERCEQRLHLDNSLPGSLRAMKSIGDGSQCTPCTPRLVCRVSHVHRCALALPALALA